MSLPTPIWVTAVSILPMCLLFVGIGLFFRRRGGRLLRATTATVVSVDEMHRDATVEFVDDRGRLVVVEAFETGWPTAIGEQVSVVYDRRDPNRVWDGDRVDDGVAPFRVFLVLAGALAILGAVVAIVAVLTGS
jgi:hypothetical protein